MSTCTETMVSQAVPDHVHTCNGRHDDDGSHFCALCRRWWWHA